MKDNLSVVITMLVFVILIIIFPLYNYFERQDDMSYNLVLKATTNFVDQAINYGYIDQDMYDRFTSEISKTGNIYNVELEAHRKTYIGNEEDGYKEKYLIKYNSQIFDQIESDTQPSDLNKKVLKGGAFYMEEGDKLYVRVENSNTTMAGAIFNTIVPTASKERVVVDYGGVVKNTAWNLVNAEYNALIKYYNVEFSTDNGKIEAKNSSDETISSGYSTTKGDKITLDWSSNNSIYSFDHWEDQNGTNLGSDLKLEVIINNDIKIKAITSMGTTNLKIDIVGQGSVKVTAKDGYNNVDIATINISSTVKIQNNYTDIKVEPQEEYISIDGVSIKNKFVSWKKPNAVGTNDKTISFNNTNSINSGTYIATFNVEKLTRDNISEIQIRITDKVGNYKIDTNNKTIITNSSSNNTDSFVAAKLYFVFKDASGNEKITSRLSSEYFDLGSLTFVWKGTINYQGNSKYWNYFFDSSFPENLDLPRNDARNEERIRVNKEYFINVGVENGESRASSKMYGFACSNGKIVKLIDY